MPRKGTQRIITIAQINTTDLHDQISRHQTCLSGTAFRSSAHDGNAAYARFRSEQNAKHRSFSTFLVFPIASNMKLREAARGIFQRFSGTLYLYLELSDLFRSLSLRHLRAQREYRDIKQVL